MIRYTNKLDNIKKEDLRGFFQGWPSPPSEEKHLEILKNSTYIWLAINENNDVVGFINSISDKCLSAYIPLLEVKPEYKNKGIGTELVKRMIESLGDYYMVDLLCDEDVIPFYKRLNMFEVKGMVIRNYNKQSGK